MKRLIAFFALCAALTAQAQDFNTIYDKTEFAKHIGEDIKDGPIRPVWEEGNSFLYKSGDQVWRVANGVKTPATQEELDARLKRFRRGFYDPSDESPFAHKKEVKEVAPDSSLTAFVRDNNVWIQADGQPPVQLSFDGTEGDSYVRLQWSPDSKKLAALRKQVLKERQILLRTSRPEDQVQPTYRWLDYAKPGDALPQCTPALFDAVARKAIPLSIEIPKDQYFLELGQWSPNSDWFTYEYNQRGHQCYQLCAVDAATGEVRVLADERSNTFIYYYDLWRHCTPDGKYFYWISERDNWRHLYRIDTRTLEMTQLTKGEWNVREIHHVADDYILFNANGLHAAQGEDPYNKHVLRLNLNNLEIKDLTPENANHTVSFSPDRSCFVDNYSRPDLPSTTVLRSAADGSVQLPIQQADISALLKKGYTLPEVFVAKGRDGVTDIWGTIYRPVKFNPKKKYPVVEYIYAGPHDNHVEKNFMTVSPRYARLLELGFIVVTIDGMGTDNRSKSFQDVAWRNLKDAGFPDRILWMQAAARKYKYMDLSKVGIYGYSAGGQNTLSALLFYPEFYKVGVALCGCHDNRMDKIWWNEQWMGYPIGPWYSESSNVDNAWRLEGKLLIINGEMDDNVDPASSLQVVSELIRHNKDFEQFYLPGFTHNLGADWVTKRIYEFFWRNCR